mmetsp:Transcript_22617/g.52740  ORF Transcript_22617/g.52740 Transcript_22617/m.52740 type:complete len:654 (+) Transcript_22617:78-2039(+)
MNGSAAAAAVAGHRAPPMRSTTTVSKTDLNVEASVAAAEVRLRSMVMEALRGPVERIGSLQADFTNLKALTNQQVRAVHQMQQEQYNAAQQVNSIAAFREEMTKWDTARLKQEQHVDSLLSSMQVKLEGFGHVVENRGVVLQELQRSVDRIGIDITHSTSTYQNSNQAVQGRIEEVSKQLASAMTDVEVKLQSSEVAHHALVDELWGEEMSIAKLGGELKRAHETLLQLQGSIEVLEEEKANVKDIEQLRLDLEAAMRRAAELTNSLRDSVGDIVEQVRAHFKTSMDTAATHVSSLISTVQQEHKEEMARAADVRADVLQFMEKMERRWSSMEERLTQQNTLVNNLAAERREEMEELYRQRKKDKSAAESEIRTLDMRVQGIFERVSKNNEVVQYLRGVQEMLLESNLIQASIEIQDVQDRQKIALMGIKDEEAALARSLQTEPQKPRPEVRQKGGKRLQPAAVECEDQQSESERTLSSPGSVAGATLLPSPARIAGTKSVVSKQAPIMRVDDRCIACSGQAPFVLSAFKLACLHYTPSRVPHAGQSHDRVELLDERRDLLARAQKMLSSAVVDDTQRKLPSREMTAKKSLSEKAATGASSHPLAPYASLQASGSSAAAAEKPPASLPQLTTSVVAATRALAGVAGSRPLTVR